MTDTHASLEAPSGWVLPSNPDFLLRRGELLDTVGGRLAVVDYDDLVVSAPRPAVVQRLCATRDRV